MKSCEIGGDKPGPDQIERLKKIKSKIPEDDVLYENADSIKALGDPTRLKIIYLLKYGELCVCEIIHCNGKTTTNYITPFKHLKKSWFFKMA